MNKNIFLRAFALKYSVGYNPFSPSGFFTFSRLITKKRSALFPQSTFRCSAVFSEQTATIPVQRYLTGFYNRDGKC